MEKCMKIKKIERDKGVSFKHPKGHLNTPIKHSNIQKFFFSYFIIHYILNFKIVLESFQIKSLSLKLMSNYIKTKRKIKYFKIRKFFIIKYQRFSPLLVDKRLYTLLFIYPMPHITLLYLI